MPLHDGHPLTCALRALNGRALAPTPEALQAIGWRSTTQYAIHQRRRAGTLPVAEIKIGGHYYVTAAALADAFFRPRDSADAVSTVHDAPPRRGPGRPRKLAPASPYGNQPAHVSGAAPRTGGAP